MANEPLASADCDSARDFLRKLGGATLFAPVHKGSQPFTTLRCSPPLSFPQEGEIVCTTAAMHDEVLAIARVL